MLTSNEPFIRFNYYLSNIPAAPAYGVYISQLIRYSRLSGSYRYFFERGLVLTRKLLNQGLLLVKLKSSLTQWPKEKGQTTIYKKLHRKQKIE
jgi:hypothetical protein